MFELFCVGNASCIEHKSIRVKALCLCIIFIMAAVVAIAAPLQTLAAGSAISKFISIVLGALAAYAAFPAIVAAAGGVAALSVPIGIIGCILIAMGVSLSVELICDAIAGAVESGAWGDFCQRVQSDWEARHIEQNSVFENERTFKFGPSALSYCYYWVKLHIVGFHDQEVEVESDDGIAAPIENPFNYDIKAYQRMFKGIPFIELPGYYSDKSSDFKYAGYLYSEPLMSDHQDIHLQFGDFDYYNFDMTFERMGNDFFDSSYCDYVSFKNDNINFWYVNGSSEVLNNNGLANVCLPVFDHNNKTIICNEVLSRRQYHSNNDTWTYWVNEWATQSFRMKYIEVDNKLYKFKSNDQSSDWKSSTYVDDEGNEYTVTVTVDGVAQRQYGAVNNNLPYSVIYEDGEVSIKSKTSDDVKKVKLARKTTKVNPYYNAKVDTLATTAGKIKEKEDEGVITSTTAGTISVGISDSISASDVNSASKVSDVAKTSSLSISDTAVEVGTIDVPIFTSFQIAGNNIQIAAGELRYKFPFDVIYSVSQWLKALVTVGEPLVIDYSFTVPGFHNPVHVHIDFNKYQTIVTVANWVVLVSCAIGCLIASRKALDAM